MTRRSILAIAVGWIAAGCGPDGEPDPSRGAPPAERPSVVLVTLDTTRADRLGCYGRADAGTPHLDALAARGVRFETARTAAPITLPAHATILTGLYPMSHGVHDNGIASLGPSARTLPELLQDEATSTGAFVAAFVLSDRFGLDQGFSRYDEVPNTRLLSGGLMEERPADQVVDAALAWLAEVRGWFFLWVHLFDPHHPYAPPAPFATRFAGDPYQGEIAFADQELGRLFRAVDARDGEVVFAVTADHGESLGEHGEATHAAFVYDATMRVPLILAGAGVPTGAVVQDPVATVDVAPTLLELSAVEPPSGLDGVSLVPLFTGGEVRRPRPILLETYWGYLNHGWSPLLAVCDETRKLIDAPRAELYDLVADPGEEVNRFEVTDKGALAMRRAARAAWGRRTSLASSRQLTPEERRTLDQMGYLGDASEAGDVPLPGGDRPDPKERIALLDLQNEALDLLSRFDHTGDASHLDRAIEGLSEGLRTSPNGAILNEFMALALAKRGDHRAAIPHFKKCLAVRPDNLDARFGLAYSLVHSGDPTRGRRELLRCLEQEPSFVKAARLLAVIHEGYGAVDEAIANWQYFVDHYPFDDGEASHARRELLRLKEQRDAERSSGGGMSREREPR